MTVNGPDGKTYTIEGATPDSITPEEARQYVRRAMEQGVTTIQYQDSAPSMTMQDRARERATLERAAQQNPSPTSTLQERARQRMEAEAAQPQTDPAGLAGGFFRGAAPYAAAAGAGAAAGSVIPGLGTAAGAGLGLGSAAVTQIVAPAVTRFVNNILGTTYEDPREAARAFFTQMGVPEPDTRAEQLVQDVTNSGAQALGMVSGAGLMAAGAPALGAPSTAQGAAQQLAFQPGQQIQGALRAPIGAEAGRRVAEATNMGPGGTAAMQFLGGMGADASASVMPTPGRAATRRAAQSLESENVPVARVRQAIQEGQERGSELLRSDVFPPNTPLGRAFQSMREAFGTAGVRAEQQMGRNRAINDVLEEFQLSPGVVQELSPQMAQDFVSRRRGAFTRYGTQKAEALATVPTDEAIEVPNTVQFIDDQIESLTRRGGANADVNTAVDTGAMTADDVRQRNPNQGLIDTLRQWRAAFQNKNIEDLELNRRDFGNIFIPDEGYGALKPREREVVDGLYDNVRRDIGEAVRRNGGEEAYENWADANENLAALQRDLNREVIENLVAPLRGQRNVDIDPNTPVELYPDEVQGTVMRLEQKPELLENIAINGETSDIQTVAPYLSPQGRRTMVSSMIQADLIKATPNIYDVSPSRFSTALSESLNRRRPLMTPEDEKVLDGLQIFLDRTRRSEFVAGRPPDSPLDAAPQVPGVKYTIARQLSSGAGDIIGTAVGGMLTGRNLARAYESPETRDLLLELVETGVESPRSGLIMSSIMRAMANEDRRGDAIEAVEGAGRAGVQLGRDVFGSEVPMTPETTQLRME